jgi:hypothetical protein
VFASISYSQPTTKIKVKKQNDIVYFYQKDLKTDTILIHKNNLFYFVLNDTLKQNTQILIDNGKLVSTKNDSIIEFVFMPGLKYESKFLKENKQLKFVSLINGTTSFNKNEITIKVVSNTQDNPLIENKFYYKN